MKPNFMGDKLISCSSKHKSCSHLQMTADGMLSAACRLILSYYGDQCQERVFFIWFENQILKDEMVCTVCAVNIVNQRNNVGHVVINHFKGTLQINHVSFNCQNTENVSLTGYKLYTCWMQLSLTSTWGCRVLSRQCGYILLFVLFLRPSYSLSDMHSHRHTLYNTQQTRA